MDIHAFRALVKQEKVRGRVKGAFIVIGGIAYKPEQYESYLFHSWLTERGIFAQHNANERRCSAPEMVMLKSMGLLPGASDHLVFDSPPAFPYIKGVAVELKTQKGAARANQKGYIGELRRRGWLGAICITAQEAINYMVSLGFPEHANVSLTVAQRSHNVLVTEGATIPKGSVDHRHRIDLF